MEKDWEEMVMRIYSVGSARAGGRVTLKQKLAAVNQELWLILSLFVIAALLNWLLDSERMILGFYTLPTLFSAYVYGRRHAVLTAAASALLVAGLMVSNPGRFLRHASPTTPFENLFEVVIWAGLLLLTGYAMGTLYERKESHFRELRRTYFGILTILQQFISNDKYTHNHSYRVAHYAGIIAAQMGFEEDTIDDVRAAALLHDIGKLDTSREILYKAASLTPEEMAEMRRHVKKGAALLEPVGGTLGRIIPIILSHHDRYDGSGYEPAKGEEIPIEARVLAVADAYDTLTSDRPYRRAVSPFEAKEILVAGAGKNFDPIVVEAFAKSFMKGEMEIPEALAI
jgi:putative nucleotidyltransferase with HDIG domain